jgi:hypothetical protein
LLVNILIRTVNNSSQIYINIQKENKEISESIKGSVTNELDIQFLKNLKDLSILSLREKSQSCVYINNSDSLMSKIPKGNRFSFAFFVPAITGICSIEGNSVDSLRKDFTFSVYNIKKSKNMEEIIERARQLGFKQMFEINNDYINKKSYITIVALK